MRRARRAKRPRNPRRQNNSEEKNETQQQNEKKISEEEKSKNIRGQSKGEPVEKAAPKKDIIPKNVPRTTTVRRDFYLLNCLVPFLYSDVVALMLMALEKDVSCKMNIYESLEYCCRIRIDKECL